MVWVVYKATFTTKCGTRRVYFGCTRNPEAREDELQNSGSRQPAWLKAGCRDFSYTILVPDCGTKQAALAIPTISDFSFFRQKSSQRIRKACFIFDPMANTNSVSFFLAIYFERA